MTRITVAVPARPYDVCIESGLLARAGALLREMWPRQKWLFVVTVGPVRRKWGKPLTSSLKSAGFHSVLIEMPDGETYKKLATIERLAEELITHGADRHAAILAFGGGVVGDVAGLLASLYMRGVNLVQVPTTVQAQLDAAIGGKTGVNLRHGKNLLGTFHQPCAVLIDPAVLATLPEREFRAGLYEGLKCGVIGNADLFRQFEQNKERILARDPAAVERIITDSVALKASIVSADEREDSLRRVLNFGHTIGHALEAETGYRSLLHGEAVAWGMIAATNIALSMQRTDSLTAVHIADAVLGLGRLPQVKVGSRSILRRLQADKKTRNGVVHFVLPREIGKVEVVDSVPQHLVIEAVDELRRLSQRR
ncbi:MAG TPA: 3-dehydroquinate synthase [Terriglobales bacterium]|nr:3-dehydroquinate synthase [Terriglobales bacterium]